MRGEGIQIGRIYGIPIFLHSSWFFIFALIAFSFVSEYEALNLNIPISRLWGLGLMTSVLYGLSPTDATANLAAVAVLCVVAGFASYVPARRAARVDPVVALRHE